MALVEIKGQTHWSLNATRNPARQAVFDAALVLEQPLLPSVLYAKETEGWVKKMTVLPVLPMYFSPSPPVKEKSRHALLNLVELISVSVSVSFVSISPTNTKPFASVSHSP